MGITEESTPEEPNVDEISEEDMASVVVPALIKLRLRLYVQMFNIGMMSSVTEERVASDLEVDTDDITCTVLEWMRCDERPEIKNLEAIIIDTFSCKKEKDLNELLKHVENKKYRTLARMAASIKWLNLIQSKVIANAGAVTGTQLTRSAYKKVDEAFSGFLHEWCNEYNAHVPLDDDNDDAEDSANASVASQQEQIEIQRSLANQRTVDSLGL